MLSDKLTKVTEAVVDAIKETEEYREFTQQQKSVNSDPEVKGLIEHARVLQERL